MLLSFKIISFYLASEEMLLIAEFISFSFKLFLSIVLIRHSFKVDIYKRYIWLLIGMLLGSMFYYDASGIPYHIYKIYFSDLDRRLLDFMGRLGWACFAVQNQSLVLFLDNLSQKSFRLTRYHIISILVTLSTVLFQLYFLIFKFNEPTTAASGNFWLEQKLIQFQCIHLIIIFIPCLFKIIRVIRSAKLPKILSKQLNIFLVYLICPHLILDLMINKLLFFSLIEKFMFLNEFAIRTLSSFLISYALYYCCKKMIGLRFLNLKDHVETKEKFNFINDFKDIIEELSYVKTVNELSHITQMFFQIAFKIPISKTKLYLRNLDNSIEFIHNDVEIVNKVESFVSINNNFSNVNQDNCFKKYKMLIKDEIEFSNFYHESDERTAFLVFLNNINADIFLPIYNGSKIIAYIIVGQNSRDDKLFNSKERDEMLVFTSYLSNVIHFLNYNNLDNLLKEKKELYEELYQKHQEINQYKESIRSFVRTNSDRKIGIIFYKNRKFIYANQYAKELINVDINVDSDYYLAKIFKQIVLKVQQYKSTEIFQTKGTNGNKLVLYALSGLEENSVIIMVYYPEVSDLIKDHVNLLKDPTEVDKLLYLETTVSGQLINQLIPGYGENLLNFKINLLSLALGKKAILLNLPDDDLDNTVELLHHISLKQKLYKIELNNDEKNFEIAIELFGLKYIFEQVENESDPILLQLDNIGTLFIKNVDLLQLETQDYLADFIIKGYFTKFKSDYKIFSNIRLIFSSTKNLEYLVSQGKFSKKLYNELIKAVIVMPSFVSLTDKEVIDLANGFAEQIVSSDEYKNFLSLSSNDKAKLLTQRPISLEDLKSKVQRLLISKSNQYNINCDKLTFDPAYNIVDPILAKAVRLGKKALKHQDIMTALWDKYKNQNKIASLLGVDRSSVCRRCQQYNLK